MNYEELVRYIKEDGCRVYIYDNKDAIYGGNRGTFSTNKHGPIICVANKDCTPAKKLETLVHEYAHFLQWKDEFMQSLDGIIDSYELMHNWIDNGTELSARELEIVRRAVLTMEYDAEKRAYHFGNTMELEHWKPAFYLQGAASYMDMLKWEFYSRSWCDYTPSRKTYKADTLTFDELYAPLSEKRIKEFTKNANSQMGNLRR